MTQMVGLFVGIFMITGSVYDMKSMELPVWLLISGGCGGIVIASVLLLGRQMQWWELLWALLPGGISLVLAFVTRQQLGYGDGIVLLILGGSLGMEGVFAVWILGMFLSFVVSLVLLLTQKVSKDSRLPFVPFLTISCTIIGMQGVFG